jgi:hypothetical protein
MGMQTGLLMQDEKKHKEQELPFFHIQSQSKKGKCQIHLRAAGAEVVSDGP